MYLYKTIVTLISIIFRHRQHEEPFSLPLACDHSKILYTMPFGVSLCCLVDRYPRLRVRYYGACCRVVLYSKTCLKRNLKGPEHFSAKARFPFNQGTLHTV